MQVPTGKAAYRYASVGAIATSLILIWLSLGVGIIGRDGDPANVMYFGVIAVGIIGAAIARLGSLGMARTLCAMAAAQAVVGALALFGGLGRPYSGPLELVLLNGFFVVMFVGAGWLFGRAAIGGN